MSGLRRALAAAAMAIAAAGGGLAAAAAGAVPASAATQSPAIAGHTGGHVVETITIRPASRTGPSVIQPCAVHRPGMAPAYGDGGGCDSGTVTCDIDTVIAVHLPVIDFDAIAHCSEPVPEIRLGQDVIHSTPIDPNNPLTDSEVNHNEDVLQTHNQAVCQPGQYAVNASARITPPDGDILLGSQQVTSPTETITASQCGTSGGGGSGGGCATATPSVSGHPAARHPDLITCGG